jgi:hypothetical protein
VPLPAAAWLDDSSNVLPVPAELAALRVEPPPDLDRVAIAPPPSTHSAGTNASLSFANIPTRFVSRMCT